MLQRLVALCLLTAAIALFVERHWGIGMLFLALAVGVINGASRDAWLSFEFSAPGSNDGGGSDGADGGGDGGGD